MERKPVSSRVAAPAAVPARTPDPLGIESFRSLIEHSSDLVSVLSLDGCLVYVSPSHERVLGYTAAELIGRSAFEVIHPDDVERIQAMVGEAMARATSTATSEARFRHKDGSWRVLEGKLTARFDDPMIRGAVVNARDVTDRKRAEQQLGAYARELERRQHNQQEIFYRMTHDLKSPVNSIVLIADLLLRRARGLDAEERAEVEHILQLACATEDMLRDLLGFLRLTSEAEAATWVDLAALVDRVVERLQPQLEHKRVAVEVGELPRVWGRARQLAHAVDNLIGNAVKYVPAGHGRVQVSGWCDDAGAMLFVADNGVGIPAAFHQRIFELFGRVPEVRVDGLLVEGTGVGLAIVREVAEAHGGSVTVESSEGRGSRFELHLPLRPTLMPNG
jgi:PAS domain S-box-containing protein